METVWSQATQAPLVIAACCVLMALAAYACIVVVRRRLWNYLGHWRLISIKGEFTTEHHLPEEIPVPKGEVQRVSENEFSFDEAVRWMKQFVEQRRFHRLRPVYQAALRKYELYREMVRKMGRGMWRDVDKLGQRLSELDPLDPSAMVARGRAMRELGNYAGAIRQYQKALELTPFHSTAFAEMAATCRAIGQPDRFRSTLDRARKELGDTHPLTIEGRIQLGELVRVYADPIDPATLAHIPREHYLSNVQNRLDEMTLDATGCLQAGESMLADDMPELAESLARRCDGDYGRCAETLLLKGLIARHRFSYKTAERLVRESMALDDTAGARLALAKILLGRSRNVENADDHETLVREAQQHLRLSIDRDANLFEAIQLLVEPAWEEGISAVVAAITPLCRTYEQAWGPWRALGDAYVTAGMHRQGIESYRRGLEIADADHLLLPCIEAMEESRVDRELTHFVSRIADVKSRDPQLRWKVARVLFDAQRWRESRRVLQDLVDDERVQPPLRQRANEVLDHLDSVERNKGRRRHRIRKTESE